MKGSAGDRPRRHGRKDGFLVWLALHGLFLIARIAPWLLRKSQTMWVEWSWRVSRPVRRNLLANAARLLGPDSRYVDRVYLSRDVIGHFFRFVAECGQSTRMSRAQLLARISAIEGEDLYPAIRQAHRGAIIATAHLGSFEVGLAALTEREKNIHVLFQRDDFSVFERVRSQLRRRLGVHENAIEDGWAVWLRLRDVLHDDGVVMMQADRVMPGQSGMVVPFARGHIAVPTGPARLAGLSGAPIIPIFTLRQDDGRIRIVIESPIIPDPAADGPAEVQRMVLALSRAVERHVVAFPQQWLMVQKVFREDLEA